MPDLTTHDLKEDDPELPVVGGQYADHEKLALLVDPSIDIDEVRDLVHNYAEYGSLSKRLLAYYARKGVINPEDVDTLWAMGHPSIPSSHGGLEQGRTHARYRVADKPSSVASAIVQSNILELFDAMMVFFVTEPIHQALRRTVLSFAASAAVSAARALSPFANG